MTQKNAPREGGENFSGRVKALLEEFSESEREILGLPVGVDEASLVDACKDPILGPYVCAVLELTLRRLRGS